MNKKEAKHMTREPEPAEKNTTEYIVGQLMNPKVPDEELEQYEEYVFIMYHNDFPILEDAETYP